MMTPPARQINGRRKCSRPRASKGDFSFTVILSLQEIIIYIIYQQAYRANTTKIYNTSVIKGNLKN